MGRVEVDIVCFDQQGVVIVVKQKCVGGRQREASVEGFEPSRGTDSGFRRISRGKGEDNTSSNSVAGSGKSPTD